MIVYGAVEKSLLLRYQKLKIFPVYCIENTNK